MVDGSREGARYWLREMDAAAHFMRRAAEHPLEESGEPLVDVVAAAREAGVELVCPARHRVSGTPVLPLLRSGLVPRMLAVAEELRRERCTLVLEDVFRTGAMQREVAMSEAVLDRVIEVTLAVEREVDPARVVDRLAAVVQPLPKTAGHMAGAAVDVSVIDADGRELGRGGPYLTVSETMPMASPFASPDETANRRRITAVMGRHGFVAYPYEFWHYSRDDVLARAAADDPAPARYGPVELRDDGDVEPIADLHELLNPADELLDLIARRIRQKQGEAQFGSRAGDARKRREEVEDADVS